jgi:hypothetical protein
VLEVRGPVTAILVRRHRLIAVDAPEVGAQGTKQPGVVTQSQCVCNVDQRVAQQAGISKRHGDIDDTSADCPAINTRTAMEAA